MNHDEWARVCRPIRPTNPRIASASAVTMRRFVLRRAEDVSGTSGTGEVAEGVEYSDGAVGLHWLSQLGVHAFYANMKTLLSVHSHGGKTSIEWIDA